MAFSKTGGATISWEDLAGVAFATSSKGSLPMTADDVHTYAAYDYPKCTRCINQPSLAAHVIQSFGLSINGPVLGGSVPGHDVRLQDPYSIIKLSLAYGLICGELWECYANEYGAVEFVVVGDPSLGNLASLGTVYMSIASVDYTFPCNRILITGYKPPQMRRLTGPKHLWEVAAMTAGGGHSLSGFTIYFDPRTLHILSEDSGSTEAWRGLGPIDWSNTSALNNLFGVNKNKFESIMGYAYAPHFGGRLSDSISISISQQSPRIHSMPAGFSDSHFISWWSVDKNKKDGTLSAIPGIMVPDGTADDRSSIGKWIDVQQVYVWGYPINNAYIQRNDNGDPEYAVVSMTTQTPSLHSLSRGTDYIIVKGSGGEPRIVFGNYVTDKYNTLFTTGLPMKINGNSIIDGKLRDKELPDEEDLNTKILFPRGDGSSGFAISDVVIVSTHDFPCIAISDTAGELTRMQAQLTTILCYAMVMTDAPATMYFCDNGNVRELDQSELTPDDDPTTTQFFWNTAIQIAIDSMQTGDLQLSFPFFSDSQIVTAVKHIYDLAQEGVVTLPGGFGKGYREWILTCGPDSVPKLGQYVKGSDFEGIVNDINYSYQDGTQYTVNITVGSKWVSSMFGNGWAQTANQLKVENVSREGRVIAAGSNNAEFIVFIDGFGSLACLNTGDPTNIITVGDIVKVTIYNVPQGES